MSEVLAFLEFRSGERGRGHLDFERPSKTEALFPRDSVEGNYCVPGWMLEMEKMKSVIALCFTFCIH